MTDSDPNFVEVQMGGGGPPDDMPVLTPTCLRTSIKPTDHDVGHISKAHLQCYHQMVSSSPVTEAPGPSSEVNPFLNEHEIRCASELFQDTEDVIVINFLQAPLKENPISTGYSQLSFLVIFVC